MNKEKYKEILVYFQKDLDLLNCELESLLLKNNTELNNDVLAFLFSKSKRLRPVVLFLLKDALKINAPDINKKIIKLAVALELLHSATLIHDDIIDEATLRRLNPTLHNKYNSKLAVLAGDYLLSLCLKVLSEINLPGVFYHFSENTLNICKGEIDQFFNKNKIVTIEDYIKKSENKTSSLFMAGAKSFFELINKEYKNILKAEQEAFLGYVLNFSLAFQIYDDIENFQNKNTEKLSSDIENGIYTLPYLYISQQNHSCDIIDLKNEKSYQQIQDEALDFSKAYLNDTLNKGDGCLKPFQNTYKTDMLQNLTEIFKL